MLVLCEWNEDLKLKLFLVCLQMHSATISTRHLPSLFLKAEVWNEKVCEYYLYFEFICLNKTPLINTSLCVCLPVYESFEPK